MATCHFCEKEFEPHETVYTVLYNENEPSVKVCRKCKGVIKAIAEGKASDSSGE